VHHIDIAAAHGPRGQLGRIETGVRLGDGKARLFVALDQRRQEAALLRVAAEDDDRIEAEDIHVQRGGAGEGGARFGDRLHHRRRLGDAKSAAAVGLGHGDAEPAGLGKGAMELVREVPVAIAAQPILIVEAAADP